MEDYEPTYDETAEWFYGNSPFIEVCQQNMIDLYELYGYPQKGDEVAWFLNVDNWEV